MPDGVVKGFDEHTGEGRAVRGARRAARTASSAPYSVGARRGNDPSPADEEIRRVVRLDPVAVARWWATSVATGYLDDAAAVYAPGAEIRHGDRVVAGTAEIERLLEELPICRSGRAPDNVTASSGEVVLDWEPVGEQLGLEIRTVVEHGEITAQTISEPSPPSVTADQTEDFRIEMVRHGRLPPGSVEAATAKVRRAANLSGTTVTGARVKLRQLADPAATHRAIAEASLDLDGELVRAHASADEMLDAIDRLGHRLEDRLRHRREHHSWIRPTAVEPEPGEWRHGNLASVHTPWFDRPVDEREVVRHKTWDVGAIDIDEAVFDLELLDHDFHLFVDLRTGKDSLAERSLDRYLLSQVGGAEAGAIDGVAADVSVDPTRPPTLPLGDAITQLELTAQPRLFFEDSATHRGHVVYHRLDGHYGLITPSS